MPHELHASIQAAIPDEPKGLVKAKKTIYSASLELSQEQITAYVLAGVKRDHKDVRDYELTVEFDRVDEGDDLRLVATVSGERIA